VLNKVSRSASVSQNHRGSDPNDLEGMSVIWFCTPAMCSGVSGDALLMWRRNASARISCIATLDFREAIR
jgi:hypothetical protein